MSTAARVLIGLGVGCGATSLAIHLTHDVFRPDAPDLSNGWGDYALTFVIAGLWVWLTDRRNRQKGQHR